MADGIFDFCVSSSRARIFEIYSTLFLCRLSLWPYKIRRWWFMARSLATFGEKRFEIIVAKILPRGRSR
jgi:hypothetical protein